MKDRVISIIQKLASEFINRESNRQSLITVTSVQFNPKNKRAEIFVSVYPERNTRAAVEFLNRKRDDFRDYLKKHSKLKMLPRAQFLADPVIGGTIEETE